MSTERDFQTQVVTLARYYGWRVFHPLPGMNRRGRWTTPTEGDTGWPDLALAKAGPRGGFLVAELKTDTGRLRQEQAAWLDTLRAAGVEAYLWRPAMLDAITDRLAGHGRPDRDQAAADAAALREDLADAREAIAEYRQRVHDLNERLLNANADRAALEAQLRSAEADAHYLRGDHR